MSLFSDFLDLFFPPLCICCDKRLISGERFMCLPCLDDLPKTDFHNIRDNKLEELFFGRLPLAYAASFAHFTKDGSVQKLIHELKYNNNPKLGVYLGELCGSDMCQSPFIRDIDYLIPIPLHPNREKQRGYNQSLKIAEGISSKTNIPLLPDLLIRIVDNPSQTKQQSKYERWSNTAGVFDVATEKLLKDKHILLIDDIITTGSTIESCGKILLQKNENLEISVYSFGSVSN